MAVQQTACRNMPGLLCSLTILCSASGRDCVLPQYCQSAEDGKAVSIVTEYKIIPRQVFFAEVVRNENPRWGSSHRTFLDGIARLLHGNHGLGENELSVHQTKLLREASGQKHTTK